MTQKEGHPPKPLLRVREEVGWRRVPACSLGPNRVNTAHCVWDGKIWIFGGRYCPPGRDLPETTDILTCLDPESSTMYSFAPAQPCDSRKLRGATMTAIPDCSIINPEKHPDLPQGPGLLVYGGKVVSDVSNAIFLIPLPNVGETEKGYSAIPLDINLPQRFGHTMLRQKNDTLVIFGGFDGSDDKSDTIVVILRELEGYFVIAPRSLKGRCFHTTAWTDETESVMWVWGGFGAGETAEFFQDGWVLDMNTYQWDRWQCTGPSPPPRQAAASCVLSPAKGKVLLHGGYNENGTLSDWWIISIQSAHRESFSILPHSSSDLHPLKLKGHQLCMVNDDIFLFGGQSAFGDESSKASTWNNSGW